MTDNGQDDLSSPSGWSPSSFRVASSLYPVDATLSGSGVRDTSHVWGLLGNHRSPSETLRMVPSNPLEEGCSQSLTICPSRFLLTRLFLLHGQPNFFHRIPKLIFVLFIGMHFDWMIPGIDVPVVSASISQVLRGTQEDSWHMHQFA